jgi:serine/threonine protein kinase
MLDDTMFEDIHEIAENSAYLRAVEDQGSSLDMLNSLPQYEELQHLEMRLLAENHINFEDIFHEPCGYYNIRNFLLADGSSDRAVFLYDVEAYRNMRFESARQKVAKMMYERFIAMAENEKTHHFFLPGQSTFASIQSKDEAPQHQMMAQNQQSHLHHQQPQQSRPRPQVYNSLSGQANVLGTDEDLRHIVTMGQVQNSIGIYGQIVDDVREAVTRGEAPPDVFDKIAKQVLDDLKLDVFPRFCQSPFYKRYIRCKYIETVRVTVKDFTSYRVLGRGGFGAVHACRKLNSGVFYAMKCVNKKLVKVKNALDNILEERNVLAMMQSSFVTNLKYALQDEDNLYLIMDLMLGGDLKFHLINCGKFSERRARFYAAQVLLGLEHVHSKSVIYRDMKLENVLLDQSGHCRLSDLGLAVVTTVKIKGYAGTPGYTSPEMIRNKLYGPATDIFSYGVMVYRMLCGSKPFKGRSEAELDRAVLDKKPVFPSDIFSRDAIHLLTGMLQKKAELRLGCGEKGVEEIKAQRFFQSIDWGLLEAGYIDPPFVPNKFDVNAASLKDIGEFDKTKFRHVKLDEKFRAKVRDFGYVSLLALQQELVSVMERADNDKKNDEKNAARNGLNGKPQGEDKCCSIM